MTNLPTKKATDNTAQELEALALEKATGVNANGNKVKWTDNKEEKFKALSEKLEALKEDKLPAGAITALNEEYLRVKYGRTKVVTSKYMEKGTVVENDSIELLSDIDGVFYSKNDVRFSNDYLAGEPDLCLGKIRDIKSSYDLHTFYNAELIPAYEWQLKGYMFLAKTNTIKGLKDTDNAELCYCLVNHKHYSVADAQRRIFFSQGLELGEEDEETLKLLKQTELNMIYDFDRYKRDYPYADLYIEPTERVSIEPTKRVKKFEVNITSEDIENIKRRVLLARNYLINKDLESYEKHTL